MTSLTMRALHAGKSDGVLMNARAKRRAVERIRSVAATQCFRRSRKGLVFSFASVSATFCCVP